MNRFRLRSLIGVLVFAAFFASARDATSSSSGDNPLSDLSIEDLIRVRVTTSSRTTPLEVSEAPATMHIVTEETIRIRNYQSLLDVMLDLPEVKVDAKNDPRWFGDITIRGIWGMDKFIIMVDGVRVSSPVNDTIPVMENYPVHFAKQIEIVYGPASALYGADAFSGVVNIISKKPGDIDDHGTVSIGGGTDGWYTGSVLYGESFGDDVQLTIAGQYFRDRQPDLAEIYRSDFAGRDEWLETGVFPTDFGEIAPRTPVDPQASMFLEAYGVHAGVTAGKLKISLFTNYARHPSSIANKPNNSVYNKDVAFKREINVLSGSYETRFGAVESRSQVSASWHELLPESKWRNVYTAMEPSYQYAYGRMLKAEQLFTLGVGQSLRLTAGLTYEDFLAHPDSHDLSRPVSGRHDLSGVIVNSDIYDFNPGGIPARFFTLRYSNTGALVQAYYTPSSELSLTVGARFDDSSRYGSSFNPRLGLVWKPGSRLRAKVLYGEAFLAPSPYAAYKEFGSFVSFDNGQTFQSFFMRLANPDLEPQKNRTIELAFQYLVSSELDVSFSTYYSDLSGLFTQVNDRDHGNRYGGVYPVEGHAWPIDYVETMVNLGEQKVWGGSLGFEFRRSIGERMTVAAYSALSFVDGDVDPDGRGPQGHVEVGGIAPWTLKAGADLGFSRWSVSPRLVWMNEQRTHPLQAEGFRADDPSRRQTIDGYTLVNLDVRYRFRERMSSFLRVRNLLDEKYRTVNFGAAPEGLDAGSAQVEFEDGAPQDPLRVFLGLEFGW